MSKQYLYYITLDKREISTLGEAILWFAKTEEAKDADLREAISDFVDRLCDAEVKRGFGGRGVEKYSFPLKDRDYRLCYNILCKWNGAAHGQGKPTEIVYDIIQRIQHAKRRTVRELEEAR